jgi:uncharacterized membrane protein YgdD (TMEM256/DUF423 family)
MNARLWIALGSLAGFLAVAFGAFGAHALKTRLTPELMAVYRTGVEYHFYHALALLAVGIFALLHPARTLDIAGLCFGVGILLFSGSLYALALSGVRVLGAITPFGGVLFLAGWSLLAWTAWRA